MMKKKEKDSRGKDDEIRKRKKRGWERDKMKRGRKRKIRSGGERVTT